MSQFKPASELGISEAEHAGLIRIREAFLSDTAPVNVPGDQTAGDLKGTETTRFGLHMGYPTARVTASAREEYGCGCVACIGGHLSLLIQGVDVLSGEPVEVSSRQTLRADAYVASNEAGVLGPLFYPHDLECSWGLISAGAAGHAIGNFLTTGEPDWNSALEAAGRSDLVTGA